MLDKEIAFKKKLEDQERQFKQDEAYKKLQNEKRAEFKQKTSDISSQINEANEIAKNLHRNIVFSYELIGTVGATNQSGMGNEGMELAI